MTDRPTIDEDTHRKVTAHHEAGHAVAAVMRGGSSLRSITLEPDGLGGLTLHRGFRWDLGFIAYAGQWAEAYYADCAGILPRGLTAAEYLKSGLDEAREWLEYAHPDETEEHDDWAHIVAHLDDMAAMMTAVPAHQRPTDDGVLSVWARELEAVWPAIQTVAARLLAGDVLEDSDVRGIVGR